MAFSLKRTNGRQDYRRFVIGTASTQFAKGDAIEIVNGIAQKVSAATDYVYGIVDAVECRKDKPRPAVDFKTSDQGERLELIMAAGTGMEFECDITPLVNGTAADANTDKTKVVLTLASLNDNDLIGGQVYIPEIGEQRVITEHDEAGAVQTLTVTPAFTRAPTTGDTVIAVPQSQGDVQVKLDGTNPHQRVGVAVADMSGGRCQIESVDLANKKIGVIFPQLPAA